MKLEMTGFREYDARWTYPDQIDLEGAYTLGLGLGTQFLSRGIGRKIIVGHDYRSYASDVQQALIKGLTEVGAHVLDIGLSLSPMAYFAQFHLDAPAVAMVTASHNPNGWTGVKMGFDRPCTHGPDDMSELREIVASRSWSRHSGGQVAQVSGVDEAYLDDLLEGVEVTRPMRVVCATGNGTAGAFAPKLLRRLGVDVVERHCDLDHSFPHYNPNPEALEMLEDMARAVREHRADFALGFDGDGDRCGVVDDNGREIFADKLGLLLARDIARTTPGARFLVDVKCTSLFQTDPVLGAQNCSVEYGPTGHSYMKRGLRSSGALAGFEKSGHAFFASPIGRGYDCGLRFAVEMCRMMNAHPDRSLSQLASELQPSWTSPTISANCPDTRKYQAVDRLTERLAHMKRKREPVASREIMDISMINGARATLSDGSWLLIRASSNLPKLVVVCESLQSAEDLNILVSQVRELLAAENTVGAFDQMLN